ncbi:thioredoxin family protein [Peptostreptococcaceae bacterium AGR-M142]
MVIKILGGGCKNCDTLYENAKNAASELSLDCEFEKVGDFVEIAKYGVMKTPALVVDEKVVVSGRVANKDEIKEILG